MVRMPVRGRPRQVREMKLNSRCSILFYLEVPGGWWQTVRVRPFSRAKAAKCHFDITA